VAIHRLRLLSLPHESRVDDPAFVLPSAVIPGHVKEQPTSFPGRSVRVLKSIEPRGGGTTAQAAIQPAETPR